MLDEPATKVNKPLLGIALAVVVAVGGAWFYRQAHKSPVPLPVAAAPPVVPAPLPEDTIAHPLPATAGGGSTAPLPDLSDSDGPFGAALREAAGGESATRYLVPTDLIRRIVVTTDNLLRQKVAVDKRPVVPAPGSFAADGDELHATLDPANFKRYTALVEVLKQVDMQRLVAVYVRFYPLFQKVYQDLGYPDGYFNDRLVQVIDGLLATPQIVGPIELVRPNVMYVFADPALEARPAGQKLLIRMGADNAAAVKAKLMELRAALTAAPPKR